MARDTEDLDRGWFDWNWCDWNWVHGNWFAGNGAPGISSAAGSPGQTSLLFNSAALISPSGGVDSALRQSHLVPFGEYLAVSDNRFLSPAD